MNLGAAGELGMKLKVMTFLRIQLLIAGGVALAGCSATLVKSPFESSIPAQYAPRNESPQNYGVVRYLTDGASSVVKSRIKSAYKTMYDTCNGNYDVLGTGNTESMPVYTATKSGGNVYITGASFHYKYIYFKCN